MGFVDVDVVVSYFFFSSRRRHTRCSRDWSSDVCSSDLPATGFDPANAVALTWQNRPLNPDGTPVQFLPQQIDPQIRLVGQAQSAEPILWLTLKPDTVLGLAEIGRASCRERV